jgi:hypothetical protein
MSNARLEILKMVAEGKISPEDGDRLLAALKEGRSPRDGSGTADDSGSRDTGEQGQSGPRNAQGSARSQESFRSATENLGRAFEDAAGAVRAAATEGMRAFQKVFDEHRPGTEPVPLEGNTFEVPEGATLRIHPAIRLSVGGGSAGSSILVRPVDGDLVRVVRGSAVEVHRYEKEYFLTWAKSALEIEVPSLVTSLIARGVGGNVSIYGFPGEMRIDALGGTVVVDAPVRPFRISSVGGTIRLIDLGIRSGSSSITATGADVHISIAPDASLELRATASFGGGLVLPSGSTQVTGRTRHRGTCRFGAGAARLKVDTVAGWIHVRDPHDAAARAADEPFASPHGADPGAHAGPPEPGETPRTSPNLPPNPTRPRDSRAARDLAGEAMGDAGINAEVFGRSSRRPEGPEPSSGTAPPKDPGSVPPKDGSGSDPDPDKGGVNRS